jgi:hypothetical protein
MSKEVNLKQKLYRHDPELSRTYVLTFSASTTTPDEVLIECHAHGVSHTQVREVGVFRVKEAQELYKRFLDEGYRRHIFVTMMPEWVQQVV